MARKLGQTGKKPLLRPALSAAQDPASLADGHWCGYGTLEISQGGVSGALCLGPAWVQTREGRCAPGQQSASYMYAQQRQRIAASAIASTQGGGR